MPQGTSKSKSTYKPKDKTTHSAKARSRANSVKSSNQLSKNIKLAKLQKQTKKRHAGLTSALEHKLAERAGHTEMIAAVRSDRSKPDLEKERRSGGAGSGHGSFKKK